MSLHDTMATARQHEERMQKTYDPLHDGGRKCKHGLYACEACKASEEEAARQFQAKRAEGAKAAEEKRREAFMDAGESVITAEFAVAFLFDEEVGKEVAFAADDVRKLCPQGRIIGGRLYPHYNTPQAYAGHVQ